MPIAPIAIQGDMTDVLGLPNILVAPLGIYNSVEPTVFAGKTCMPVLTMHAPVTVHGNPFDSMAPGFNPPCAAATIMSMCSDTVFIGKEMFPAAKATVGIGSVASCGHWVAGPGCPTVFIGT